MVRGWQGLASLGTARLLLESLVYTVWVAGMATLLSCVLGLLLGLLIWRLGGRWLTLAQVFRVPIVLPHLAVALLFLLIWAPGGLIERLVPHLEPEVHWMYKPHGLALIVAYVYKEAPFVTVWVLAALRSMGYRQWEASRHLGATVWQAFWGLLWPYVRPSLAAAAILLFLFTLGAFELPWVLGSTRPSMLAIQLYNDLYNRGLEDQNRGFALLGLVSLASLLLLGGYLWALNAQRRMQVARGRGANEV